MEFLATLFLCLLPWPQAAQEVRAWQSEEPYVAPDFEAFFPDDVEGGRTLDGLYDSNLRHLEDAEYLAAIRRGLRHTKQHRTLILAGVGQRFIGGHTIQNPDAIELMYHAADFRPAAKPYGTRHYAVYFGLSMVQDKTPAILRTLAELCVAIDDTNDIGRVVWGAQAQLDQLWPFVEPFLQSEEQWVRRKAANVGRIFRGELSVQDWANERAQLPQNPVPRIEFPELRQILRSGASELRLQLLEGMTRARTTEPLHDSYLADFALAAQDPDPRVRSAVARFVSRRWIWRDGIYKLNPDGIGILMELSKDPDPDVRHEAVYYGLSGYVGEDGSVVERMLEMCLDPAQERSHGRLVWGLDKYKERASEWLLNELATATGPRAKAAHRTWWALFDSAPPVPVSGLAQASDLVGAWNVSLVQPVEGLPNGAHIRVSLDADGNLHALDAEGRDLIVDMATTAEDEVLHFTFETVREHGRHFTSGQLASGVIHAVTRLDGSLTLAVWTATKED